MPPPLSAEQLIARASELAKSQSSDALALTLQARQIATQQGAHDCEAAALCLRARILLTLGRHEEALTTLQQVHALASQQDIGSHKGEALQLQGRILFSLNQYQKAMKYWKNCLSLPASAIGNETLALAHLDLGSVYLIRDQVALALEQDRQAEELALDCDDPQLYSEAQLHVAADLVKQGQTVAALALLKEALPQVRAAKDYAQEAAVYGLIGEIHIENGELEKAQTSLMLALKINRLTACVTGEVTNLLLLGLCELRSGEIEGALDFLNTAHALALESGSKHLQAQAEQGLAQACLAANDPETAAQHAANYQRLHAEVLNQSSPE